MARHLPRKTDGRWVSTALLAAATGLATAGATSHPTARPALAPERMPIATPIPMPIATATSIAGSASAEPAQQSPPPVEAVDLGWYDGQVVEPARTLTMEVTAYCAGPCCCGRFADGITASGFSTLTNGGLLVAADTDVLPMGTLVRVPGYGGGRLVPVLDRGGAIRGNRLDLLMPTHDAALAWGRRELSVTIYEPRPRVRLAQGERR